MIMSMENSNDTFGNRTGDLPTYSAVLQKKNWVLLTKRNMSINNIRNYVYENYVSFPVVHQFLFSVSCPRGYRFIAFCITTHSTSFPLAFTPSHFRRQLPSDAICSVLRWTALTKAAARQCLFDCSLALSDCQWLQLARHRMKWKEFHGSGTGVST